MGSNFLQGELPKELLNNLKIKQLYLYSNRFIGQIPDWLGQLNQLQVLDISDNFFFGPIPSTLGNMTSLVDLEFNSNLRACHTQIVVFWRNFSVSKYYYNFLTFKIRHILNISDESAFDIF